MIGKTQAMLEEVGRAISEGRVVYVVAHSEEGAKQLRRRFLRIGEEREIRLGAGIRNEVWYDQPYGGTAVFVSGRGAAERLRGIAKEMFVDHYARMSLPYEDLRVISEINRRVRFKV